MMKSCLHDAAQCSLAFYESLSRGKRRTKHWRLLRALAESTLHSIQPDSAELHGPVEFPTNSLASWLSAPLLPASRSRFHHAVAANADGSRLDTGYISKIWRTLEIKIQEHEYDLLDIARTHGYRYFPRLIKTPGGGSGIQSMYAIVPEPVPASPTPNQPGIVLVPELSIHQAASANTDPTTDWRTAFYETWVCSAFVGFFSSLICGLIYAFGPLPVTEDPAVLSNATWYFRLMRFLCFGTTTIFLYGIFYAISNARKTDSSFVTRPWSPLVYLFAAVLVVLFLYAGVNAAETPVLMFFLSEDRQGDLRVEVLKLSVGIGLYLMAMFHNFKHATRFNEVALCRRSISALLLVLLSGAALVWPWFGEGLGPDAEAELYLPIPVGLRALLLVLIFNVWGFVCYHLIIRAGGPLKSLEDVFLNYLSCGFCEKLIIHLRHRWNQDWRL